MLQHDCVCVGEQIELLSILCPYKDFRQKAAAEDTHTQ